MSQQKQKPLEGIRVVEYGIFHAGPGGTAILGDLGADVVKIETALGDPLRYWTGVADLDFTSKNNESLMHEVSNRNKRGICLDIMHEKGRTIFHRLIKTADVFLTNIRKSTKKKIGIDYASLSAINPTIIHASVSGYGPEGPMADIGAFDPLGQALSGMMFVTGNADPELIHLGILDQTASIAISHAILTALFVRERKGIGQAVHVSLYSTALWMQYANAMLNNVLSVDPCITSDRSQHSPLRNLFRCRDGKWIIGTHHPENKYWSDFCEATGQKLLLTDNRYTDAAGNPICSAELNARFDAVFATKTRDAWMDIFRRYKLMFCPVQHIREVPNDPQAQINGYMVPFAHPDFGSINVPGYPVHFSANDAGTERPAPKLGEHTDEVLKEIGYNTEEIEGFRRESVV